MRIKFVFILAIAIVLSGCSTVGSFKATSQFSLNYEKKINRIIVFTGFEHYLITADMNDIFEEEIKRRLGECGIKVYFKPITRLDDVASDQFARKTKRLFSSFQPDTLLYIFPAGGEITTTVETGDRRGEQHYNLVISTPKNIQKALWTAQVEIRHSESFNSDTHAAANFGRSLYNRLVTDTILDKCEVKPAIELNTTDYMFDSLFMPNGREVPKYKPEHYGN